MIDALLTTRDRVQKHPTHHWIEQLGAALCGALEEHRSKVVLVTGHRRENFGQGMEDLCSAIRDMAVTHQDWLFIYPVHLNPRVQEPVQAILSGISNIHLIEPLDYLSFIWLMNRSDLILTDSGGIQEEAPSLGKPVLVMREVTERVEAVEAGTVRLVGTNRAVIRYEVERLLTKPELYQAMASITNPYGRGNSATEIVDIIERWVVDGSVSEPSSRSWAVASNVA